MKEEELGRHEMATWPVGVEVHSFKLKETLLDLFAISFRLLCENIKVEIFRTIIFPIVLDGYDTWSVTLREEHRLSIFTVVLRKVFGSECDETRDCWRLRDEEFTICTAYRILLGCPGQVEEFHGFGVKWERGLAEGY
jgi:hypothetical protein